MSLRAARSRKPGDQAFFSVLAPDATVYLGERSELETELRRMLSSNELPFFTLSVAKFLGDRELIDRAHQKLRDRALLNGTRLFISGEAPPQLPARGTIRPIPLPPKFATHLGSLVAKATRRMPSEVRDGIDIEDIVQDVLLEVASGEIPTPYDHPSLESLIQSQIASRVRSWRRAAVRREHILVNAGSLTEKYQQSSEESFIGVDSLRNILKQVDQRRDKVVSEILRLLIVSHTKSDVPDLRLSDTRRLAAQLGYTPTVVASAKKRLKRFLQSVRLNDDDV